MWWLFEPVCGWALPRSMKNDKRVLLDQKISTIPIGFNAIGIIHADYNVEICIRVAGFKHLHGLEHRPGVLLPHLEIKRNHLIRELISNSHHHVPSMFYIDQLRVFVKLMIETWHEPCFHSGLFVDEHCDLFVVQTDWVESTTEKSNFICHNTQLP